jgi:hypothetical protein
MKAEQLTIIPKEFEEKDLPNIGWIRIDSIGTENMYFTLEDGTQGYCKLF